MFINIGCNSNYLLEYLENFNDLFPKNNFYIRSLKIFFLTIIHSIDNHTILRISETSLFSIEGPVGYDIRDNEQFGGLMHQTLEFDISDDVETFDIINRDERLLILRNSYP